MNIQIFGTSKCFDTKKAERWFKERRISYQRIDLVKIGMSGGEFDSVLRAVGGIDNLVNWDAKSPDIDLLKYLSDPIQKEDKVYRPPLVTVRRSGKTGNKKVRRRPDFFSVQAAQQLLFCVLMGRRRERHGGSRDCGALLEAE